MIRPTRPTPPPPSHDELVIDWMATILMMGTSGCCKEWKIHPNSPSERSFEDARERIADFIREDAKQRGVEMRKNP